MTPRLRGYLRMMTTGNSDAEDILQDVFLSYSRRGPAPGTARAEQWLFKTARNRALNVARSAIRRSKREETYEELHLTATENPSELLARQEEGERIRHCMQQLPVDLREMLYLKAVENMTVRQISGRVGLSKSTVALRLQEALVMLSEAFHGENVTP